MNRRPEQSEYNQSPHVLEPLSSQERIEYNNLRLRALLHGQPSEIPLFTVPGTKPARPEIETLYEQATRRA